MRDKYSVLASKPYSFDRRALLLAAWHCPAALRSADGIVGRKPYGLITRFFHCIGWKRLALKLI